MNNLKHILIFSFTAALLMMMIGCNESSSSGSISGTAKTPLFKSAGTFSFSSNRGNFTANGVFDTTFSSTSASGAFKYTEGKQNFVVVFAYNVVSQTNIQMVFSGVVDTSINSTLYIMVNGSMVVSTISSTAITGTFSGNGVSVLDTTAAIAVTNGTYNSPIVEQYFAPGASPDLLIQERIKTAIRKELHLQ